METTKTQSPNPTPGLDELQSLIALTMIDNVGPKTCRSLLQHFGGAAGVFGAKPQSLMKVPYVGERICNEIKSKKGFSNAEREIEFAMKRNIKIVSWESEHYPNKLKEIADSPLVFYCLGDMPATDRPQIAIVGTRAPSPYGRKIAADFASYFARLGIVVVSGLAYGVDMEAHAATLVSGGCTTAVLGHGLDQVYPREHTLKARQIVEQGGALITEFPSGTKPDAFNFPARNRIISGLCDAVLVVEATEKGGALITARMAFEQNREVFAVPGNIGVSTSVGCNRLIRDNIAKIACSPQDVLDSLQYLLRYRTDDSHIDLPKPTVMLSEREQLVFNSLIGGPKDLDTISSETQICATDLRGILLGLEFRNVVATAPGNKYQVGD
jgi:DNA processing protein